MVIASVVVMQRSIMATDIVPGQFDDADEELLVWFVPFTVAIRNVNKMPTIILWI